MISRAIWTLSLAAISASVLAVDFAAMEEMVETFAEPPGKESLAATNCNHGSGTVRNRELPDDFDFCQPNRQSDLMRKGLYVSRQGVIKPLPTLQQSLVISSKIVVPLPATDDVEIKPQTPFVIDLALSASSKASDMKRKPGAAAQRVQVQQAPASPQIQSPQHRPALGCPDIQTFAHRGSSLKPENSVASVTHALQSGHNGVEIDVQPLRDGRWVSAP